MTKAPTANICRTDSELRNIERSPIQSDIICGAKVTITAHNGNIISPSNLSERPNRRVVSAGAVANDRAKAGNITPEIAAGTSNGLAGNFHRNRIRGKRRHRQESADHEAIEIDHDRSDDV